MDIKKLLGDAYKEEMTVEELMKALSAVPEPKEPAEEMVPKRYFDKASSELAEMKRKAKEKMTADEQAAQEKKELADQLAESQKALARIKQEKAFEESGYDSKTATTLAEMLEKGDIDGFVKAQGEYMAETMKKREAEMKTELLGGTPKIPQGGSAVESSDVVLAKQAAQSAVTAMASSKSVLEHYK